MKKILVSLLTGALVLGLAGCGSSGYSANSAKADEAYESPEFAEEEVLTEEAPYASYDAEELEAGVGEGSALKASDDIAQADQKIVYTCDMQVETQEYDDTVAKIRERITKAGGIISYENESDSNRQWYYSDGGSGRMTLYLTVMVPSEDFRSFVDDVSGYARVVSKSMNAENITKSYGDTKALVESYETELKRLQEFMEKAQNIEEMMAVEERIAEVESQLNVYRSELSNMDTSVKYSTVNINITEVKEYTPDPVEEKTFGQRVKETFGDSWEAFTGFLEGALYALIYLLPFLILIAIIAVVVVLIVRAVRKKKGPRPPKAPKAPKFKKGTGAQAEQVAQKLNQAAQPAAGQKAETAANAAAQPGAQAQPAHNGAAQDDQIAKLRAEVKQDV